MSCSNSNFSIIATMSTSASAITIASFAKVKTSDFQTRFTVSSGFFALLTSARHSVKVENWSGLTFLYA